MKILLVEDDERARKILRLMLESEGHTAIEAADGVEGLRLLDQERVDAVISDVLMPRMDGYRLCYEIRRTRKFRDIPLIIYSSTFSSRSDEDLALYVGA